MNDDSGLPHLLSADLDGTWGAGPTTGLAHATTSPSLAIEVGAELLALEPADPVNARIDLVCLQFGYAQIVTGTPWPVPYAPATPDGWLSIAHVRIPTFATSVSESDITEVRP